MGLQVLALVCLVGAIVTGFIRKMEHWSILIQ